MAAPNSSVASVDSGRMLPAFAKLEGEDFVYFMRKYSIILGRSTETCKVDFDLSELGGGRGPRVSRHHARIFYDFEHRHFALEVIGKNGCSVRDVSYLPGNVPIKLNSQDLIEISGKKFYFLPAKCNFSPNLAAFLAARGARASLLPQSSSLILPDPGHSYADDYGRSNGENGVNQSSFSGELDISNSYGNTTDPAGAHDMDTEDQQLIEEERDVVSSLVDLISDMHSPRGWMTMEALHSELFRRFAMTWPSSRVRRYLEDDSVSSTETEGKHWRILLPLLRRHPEHFVMGTVTRGEVTSEYVSLVSLASLGNGP